MTQSRESPPAHANSEQQNWYIAILVHQSSIEGAADYEPKVDLQYTLVRACGIEQAYSEALRLGRAADHSYRNASGETVHWRFAGLAELDEIYGEHPDHGVEVYGRIENGLAEHYVVPKQKLAVFWDEAHKHRTAREILKQGENAE